MNPLLAEVADFQRQTRRPLTQQEINEAVRSLHGRPDPPPPYQSLVYSRPTQNVAQDNALYGAGPSISSHTPSWAESAGNAIYGAARWAGLDSQADRMRNEAVNLPIVGDAITGLEAAHDFAQGDILSGAGNLSLAAIGLVPGVGDLAAAGARRGIRAYHGSPHNFDRFDMSRMGTGEGAQAYGHGLYFAENPEVARSYIGSAQHPDLSIAHSALRQHGGDPQAAINALRASVRPGVRAEHSPALQAIAQIEAGSAGGNLYEVNINAGLEDLLDWDAPISGQPIAGPIVQGLIDQHRLVPRISETDQIMSDLLSANWSEGGASAYNALRSDVGSSRLRPYVNANYPELAAAGGKPIASAMLRDAGIPGISFLDAGSRGTGEGTRNFVIFDDSIIDILNKY